MAFLVFKKCFGCFDLNLSSKILGFILLVYKVIWLVFGTFNIIRFINFLKSMYYYHRNLKTILATSIIDVIKGIIEITVIIVILIGLFRNKRNYLLACYPPLAFCYVLEIGLTIYSVVNYGMPYHEIHMAVMIGISYLFKVVMPAFILMIRSHYYQTGNVVNGEVQSAAKPSKIGIHYI